MTNECKICGDSFEAKTTKRQFCDKCQRNSQRAKQKIDGIILNNKLRMGEHRSQQYHECFCKRCKKQFVSYGKRELFCSEECKNHNIVEDARCPVCNVLLSSLGIVVKSGRTTCSDKCREILRWQKARHNGKIGICKICGKEFVKINYYDICCSKECNKQYDLAHPKQEPTFTPVQFITSNCKICGREFCHHISMPQDTCKKCLKENRNDCERAIMVQKALNNTISDIEIKKLHLCTQCKTSQAICYMFTSNFTYHPEGASVKLVQGHNVVLKCPQYIGTLNN